jgi:exopolysaccharide production protein ExoQ
MTAAAMRNPEPAGTIRRQPTSWLMTAVSWIMIVMMIVPSSLYSGGGEEGGAEGNLLTRALWLAILAIGTVVALSRSALSLRVCRRLNVFMLLFMLLAAASIVWSIDPSQTVRNIVRMLTMFAASLACAVVGWNPRRYQQLVRPVLTATLIGSIVLGIVSPDLAIHHELSVELANAWHGLFPTKNALGTAASFTFILWAHAWLTRETRRGTAVLGMTIAGACLVLSRSSTSIITTILTSSMLLLLVHTPSSWRRAIPYLTSGLVGMILLFSLAMLKVVPGLEILVAPIPAITGKDLTFSNRSKIWAAVVEHGKFRPLLGSGYAAYWTMGNPTPDMESYAIKSQLEGFYPGSAHNGYLQVLNDLGAVGLCCLLAYLYVFIRDSLQLYRVDRSQGALFLVLFLQQATVNLTEPLWFNVLLVEFVLMLMATTCLARSLLELRVQPARAAGFPPEGRRPGLRRPYGLRRGSVKRAGWPRP